MKPVDRNVRRAQLAHAAEVRRQKALTGDYVATPYEDAYVPVSDVPGRTRHYERVRRRELANMARVLGIEPGPEPE